MSISKIPKTIHYCWFGGKPLPDEAKKCIASWKKYCPNYKVIEWNESNYNVEKNSYTKAMYNAKQWAFLSDYVRLDVIYSHGGIYLDTDVELIKPLNPLLENDTYMGMEEPGRIATGLGYGSVSGAKILKELKDYYENEVIKNKTTCVDITTKIFEEKGLKNINSIQNIEGIVIYPTDYFCPIKLGTRRAKITENTYSIHHYSASWKSRNKLLREVSYRLIPLKVIVKKAVKHGK